MQTYKDFITEASTNIDDFYDEVEAEAIKKFPKNKKMSKKEVEKYIQTIWDNLLKKNKKIKDYINNNKDSKVKSNFAEIVNNVYIAQP
jgi:predicted AlkP superfamily phosphohydrolase/phosphomutase